jgi:hypothetical protein
VSSYSVFKKPFQRGRSQQRGEAYLFRYVEPLRDARTKLGERRVSARRGWAGEMGGFFNTLHGFSLNCDRCIVTMRPIAIMN